MPGGSSLWICGSSARTAVDVSSAFAPGEAKMPRNVPSWPLKETRTSSFSAPYSIVATSERRTISSPVARTGERAERFRRLQRRRRLDGVGDELVLRLAGRGEEVRGADGGQHVDSR